MKISKRVLSLLLVMLLFLSYIPGGFAQTGAVLKLGNSDLNILNGGRMLTDGGNFYFSASDGIYRQTGDDTKRLTAETGKNLNLAGGYIYFTDNLGAVRRVPASGGESESVFKCDSGVERLYILEGSTFLYLAGGRAWERSLNGPAVSISDLSDILEVIPTAYGNIFLKGEAFDYDLYINGRLAISGVTGCYTDSGYLALSFGSENKMVALEKLFGVFNPDTDIEDFHIHQAVAVAHLFGTADTVCAECEYNAAHYDEFAAELFSVMALMEEEGYTEEEELPFSPPEVSQGQLNIILRARQMSEIEWTPIEDRYQWGYYGVFTAGTTYVGLPYGQPVYTGYVPWNLSYQSFTDSVNDNTSLFYTKYSDYNKIAPTYSCDCSSFVSYAWGTKTRMTTYSLPQVAERVGDQSIYSLQVGDCFNHSTSHVVLVSDVRYNADGEMVAVEIMEQTPVITRKTLYGEGGTQPLSRLQSYYLGGGYVIYRNPERDSVTYTHSCAVPIDGDYCASCKETAPRAKTDSYVGKKTVELSHSYSGAEIYYTTDGSAPTVNSQRYNGTLEFYENTKLRAIAVTDRFANSSILEYAVKLPPVSAPYAAVQSGMSNGNLVSAGSTITLKSDSPGVVLYYTTDGTEPTTGSAKYTGPITISQDTVIKVFGQAPGMVDSEIVTIEYKIGAVYTISVTQSTGGQISPSGSVQVLETGEKSFTITANTGYAISDVTVDGESVGAVSGYTFKDIFSDHTISAVFRATGDLPFSDVSWDEWYYPAVSTVYKSGLFAGTSDSTFSPNDSMNRAMFVTVLGRQAGVSGNLTSGIGVISASEVRIRQETNTTSGVLATVGMYTAVQTIGLSGEWVQVRYGDVEGYIRSDLIKLYGGNFVDVPDDQYYSAYVEWAYLSGIVNGTSQNTYSPQDSITREQMCTLIYNYAKAFGIDLGTVNSKSTFTDDWAISSWAREAVYALQASGIVNGVGDGRFDPQGTATRSQVAQIFSNFLEAVSE